MELHKRGARVKVSIKDQPTIDGWLWGVTPQGILVSLDKEGNNIRFIKNEDSPRIDFEDNDIAGFAIPNAREIEHKIAQLKDDLEIPLKAALSNLDYSLLNQIVTDARSREEKLRRRSKTLATIGYPIALRSKTFTNTKSMSRFALTGASRTS